MIWPTNWKNWLIFGGDPVPDTDSGSRFHFPQYCGTGDFRTFISISHTVTADFHADKIMNPQNFGSDPADIRFRIRINREIRIRIPDHFWLKFWSRQWFALSENNLVTYAVFFRYNETICSTRNDLDKSWNATLTSWRIDTWDRISQGIIDEAIDQWQTRLHACVKAKDVTSNTYCDLDTQPALFGATYTPNCFISEPFTLLRGRQHKFSVCNVR